MEPNITNPTNVLAGVQRASGKALVPTTTGGDRANLIHVEGIGYVADGLLESLDASIKTLFETPGDHALLGRLNALRQALEGVVAEAGRASRDALRAIEDAARAAREADEDYA